MPIIPGSKIVGPAPHVPDRTGDWAKSRLRRSISHSRGDIIVIDAGASHRRCGEACDGIGVGQEGCRPVVEGAVRDTPEILKLGFPVWTRLSVPNAAEAKVSVRSTCRS